MVYPTSPPLTKGRKIVDAERNYKNPKRRIPDTAKELGKTAGNPDNAFKKGV